MSPPRLRRILAIAAVYVAAPLALLLVLEGVARWRLGDEPSRALFFSPELHHAGRPFVASHPVRGFALRPGFESPTIHINAEGFRGSELPADLDARFVVLAIGDSTVFGWGVRDAESWPAQLQSRLAAAGVDRPLVVNAGTPSYTSRQVLLYLEEILPTLEPDLVLVGVLWNDLWFSSLDPWYPEVLVQRRPDPWRLTLHRHSALYRWIEERGRGSRRRDVVNERALRHFADNLEAVIDLCEDHGVALAFVAAPYDASMLQPDGGMRLGQLDFTPPFVHELARRYTAALRERADARGVPWIDHALSVTRTPPPGLFLDAIHANPQGHALVARDVARFVLETRSR